ncbi:poly-beta-1,6-N-acetyl-D-glucosamine N-deacetylase PgaB [Limisalsivibrio acetivorans]|uniref:poly-beta-1,6-N-acetyl-D-glucosamine N-deacetylase PgaB n=1 Tax=Limisalsivibrio acetivorans TaxID=1304888 RepID=UPI0003B70362|nr:poly-beta-1,6-N-acetyl-D-glucosamine N-deacetylase PgaB [Limisalsivibrio acetivorans]
MRILSIIFVLTVLASNAYSKGVTLLEREYPHLTGAQIFVLDPSYNGDLGRFFDEVQDAGANTVFLRVFHNSVDRYHLGMDSECSTGVYFHTEEACVVDDLLKRAVVEAEIRGMKLYAWMATRTLSFLKTPVLMERTFIDGGTSGEGYGASIFKPAVRRKLIRLFEDLAAYDIDGILFQDDFIMRYREGASLPAIQRYYVDSGVFLDSDSLFSCSGGNNRTKVPGGCNDVYIPWAKWKTEMLAQFFGELRMAVLKRNPSIRFAANVYYETPLDDMIGMSWYSQSIDRLMKAGFDYFAVMCYHDQIKNELNLSDIETKSYVNSIVNSLVSKVKEPSRVLVKLQRISWQDKSVIPGEEMKGVCSILDSYGGVSKALVPVNHADDIKGDCFNGG